MVQVTLKSGDKKLVFAHIEFESHPTTSVGERMFRHYRRIYDSFGEDITAIVIYTGWNFPKVFDRYEKIIFGTRLTYSFNTYKIKEQTEEDLIQNPNPFVIVVLANLYVLQSKNDDTKRLTFKEKVYELAKKRNYSKEKTTKLLIFTRINKTS